MARRSEGNSRSQQAEGGRALTRNAMPYDPESEGIKGLLFFIFVMPFVVAWALLCHLFGVEWDEGGERSQKGKDEQ